MLALTRENYEQTTGENEILVIDFWADWCAPCKSYGLIFEKVSKQYPDIAFAKLNTEAEIGLSDHFFVQNLPTTVLMKEKTVIYKRPGLLPETELRELIEKVKALDMEQFRAQKEAAKAARRNKH